MKDGDIFLCFDCGTKNRVSGGNYAKARCGRCGSSLSGDKYASQPMKHADKAPRSKYSSSSNDPPSASSSVFSVMTWCSIAAVAIGLLAYTEFEDNWYLDLQEASTSSADAALSPALAKEVPNLVPVPIYHGILVNYTNREPLAPFEIITNPGLNYFLKLIDLSTGRDAVTIYVHGGQHLEVTVPTGTYELRYASGTIWYGKSLYFDPETSYSKSEDVFKFDPYSGYTIELIEQIGGNMETRTISAQNF